MLGMIGAPHGVRGELRIRSFTADPAALGDYGPLTGSDGGVYRIKSARAAKEVIIARLEGIDSRDQAERLKGIELSIDRAALPSDALAEDEFYHADLIGLNAVALNDAAIGEIVAIHNFGGGDILEIRTTARKTIMVPFSAAAVPRIDTGSGIVVIDPAAAGMVDDDSGAD